MRVRMPRVYAQLRPLRYHRAHTFDQEESMASRAEALAKQFETKVQEATAAIERVSDADWKKVTEAEKWSVGVVAHHVAMAHAGLGRAIKTVVDGKTGAGGSMDAIHAGNAKHAQEFAACTKSETLELHKKNAAATAALVRGLSDAQLDTKGTLLAGMEPISAAQLAGGLLCTHIDEHLRSIRATVGH
jgi:hypothetical protein